jgi:hypothetical protein
MEVLFLFLLLFFIFDLHHDVPLYLLLFLLIIMAPFTLIWYGGRRRERDLFLFTAISCTKASEGIGDVFKW